MTRIWKTLLWVGLPLLAGGAGVTYGLWQDLKAQGHHAFVPDRTDPIQVTIPKGTSPRGIARLLRDAGVIEDDTRFFRYLRFITKNAETLQAGEYVLQADMTGDEIIAELQTGRSKELRFTIPEGSRKEDIARIVGASGIATEARMLEVMQQSKWRQAFGVPDTGAGGQAQIPGGIEGYLFPDTYQFPKGTSAETIVQRMGERLREVVDTRMKARMNEMGWSLHKVLTLAAIVEKETGQPHERPHISSVFHNRLRKDMKLQTDPTVIYGIQNYDGNIRKKDLLTPHPYNTYTMKGLPPGPIASPGKAAIEAALWPDTNSDLYFVSRNDGTHIFCPTLTCHNAAVQKWQVEFFRQKKSRAQ